MTEMDERAKRGATWICPNDRHLTLRAQLQRGWSVKTASFEHHGWGQHPNFSKSSANRSGQSVSLSEDEQQAINQVMRRAEAVDLSEQERIGRMVERLENLKRNIVTLTRSKDRRGCGRRCSDGACVCSCALCGEKFGMMLWTSTNLCKDCRKYICQKCSIEATEPNPSKGSDDESDATWWRSSLRIIKFAQESTLLQKIIQRSQRQFLCRICAETREMWKKSGAWFFNSMPKYILPEKKERGWFRPGPRTSTWTIGGPCKSLDSINAQDSSSDDDATRRPTAVRGRSVSPTNPSNRKDIPTKKLTVSNPLGTAASPRSPRARANGLPSLGKDTSCDRLDKSCPSIASQCNSRFSSTGSVGTPRSKARSPNEARAETHEPFEDVFVDERSNEADDEDTEKTRKDASVKSKGSQSIRMKTPMTTPSAMATKPTERFQTMSKILERNARRDASRSCSDQDTPSSRIRNSQIGTAKNQAQKLPEKTGHGTLEVSLRYDPADQCLKCKVERARSLMPMDIQGLADPFCKLNILPTEKATTNWLLRTKTVHKTCDPEFKETVNFYGIMETDISSGKALHILILQDDPLGQDFLGEARFPLYELQSYQMKRYKVSLRSHYPVDNEEETWGTCSDTRGKVQISLSYCTCRHALLVTVHRAMNLLDSNGFSDPFVKLALVEYTDNHRQQRFLDYSVARATAKKLDGKKAVGCGSQNTNIKGKILSPEWNEEFAFTTHLMELKKLTLYLSVWNKDFGKSNEYLGGLMLGCDSKGARLRHWIDTIKFPDHRFLAWHNLADIDIPMKR